MHRDSKERYKPIVWLNANLTLSLSLTLTLTITLSLTLNLTLTLSERNALLWRPVNYNLAQIFVTVLIHYEKRAVIT